MSTNDEKTAEHEVNSIALLGCPFCGCIPWLHSHGNIFNGARGHRVECEGECHSMTCYWHTKEQAFEAWNRRQPNTLLSCRKPKLEKIMPEKTNDQTAPDVSGKSQTTGSEENFVPFLERLTPKQRKKFDKGMARLRKRFRNRNKFLPKLKRAIRNFD